MGNFIQEDGNAFKGGLAGGVFICGILFFGDVFNFASQYIVKLLLTGVGGVLGGLGTAYGKHLFEKYKNRKNGKESSKEESSQKKSNAA